MRISLNWLKEFVDFHMSSEELAERLEMTGTALESITKVGADFSGVITGYVKAVEQHPKADRLHLCKVDVGRGEDLSIVCGAPNVAVGQKVAVAVVGSTLPGGAKIGKAVIRDVPSEGMMASETELGLGEDASGIMVLDENIPIGVDLKEALDLDDYIIDFEITPNRPDCMSMVGIAREVAALIGGKLRMPELRLKEEEPPANSQAQVEVNDVDLCPRYSARVVTDLTVKPSPFWMRQRLVKGGIRPINNLVDVTNYVLLELGQPLHAFDLELLKDETIIVRRAKPRETIETLDGETHELSPEMLVIADKSRPVALAGIMGGANTEIRDETTRCLIESAYFTAETVCRTGYALDMRSEASSRFERGLDPNGTMFAADRAAQLMAELGGGKVLRGAIDVYPEKVAPKTITLRSARVNGILGTVLNEEEIAGTLNRIELETTVEANISVTVPTFRPDLEREIDLVEEVGRLYGYENMPSTLPSATGQHGGRTPAQYAAMTVRNTLIASGLDEIVTYAFIDPKDLASVDAEERWRLVKLMNPLSEEQSVLRPTLLPGLLKTIKYNTNYGQKDVQICEMGRVFAARDGSGLPDEEVRAAFALTGAWDDDEWYGDPSPVDLFDAKGIVEAVIARLGFSGATVVRASYPWLHPGKAASVMLEGKEAGYFGELHPAVRDAFDLDHDVFIGDLSVDLLVGSIPDTIRVSPPSKYPAITYDLALIVDQSVPAGDIERVIRRSGGELLRAVRLFDIYQGEQVPEGKKSMAYRVVLQSTERTLKESEGEAARSAIVQALQEELGASIRS